ncbi:alpha/beta fold hydrolase (plasmid) [Streptomyces sp. NBC_01216]|uniref:thioesterase II family protein n=1 Tax=Streptomyces sp. NBC_01216 TaxID=2903778 RepID=UPI002E15279D|nr:alpha/beta fold hydrolase [Streptomyces sp. NBC_01216]
MNSPAGRREAAPALIPWATGPADGPALVCIPWAGAGAAPFRTWGPLFPPEVTVYGVRMPGRESRMSEAPLTNVTHIVDELDREIARLSHRRVAVFGHCSGALVGFELARALGPTTALLLVASQLPPEEAARGAEEELGSRASLAKRYLSSELLDDPDIVDMLLPVLEADMHAVSGYNYRSGGLREVPITVFCGVEDPEIRPCDVNGWRTETTGPMLVREVEGADHLFAGPAWQRLAACVADDLRRTLRA